MGRSTENGFNELELLSQKDLIGKLLKISKELSRREDVTRDFLKTLCSFSPEMQVWFILWEGGGAQRFTEILLVAGCSRSKLTKILYELLNRGLVRKIEKRWQAVSPALLVLK